MTRRKAAVINMLDKSYKAFFWKTSYTETSLHARMIKICSIPISLLTTTLNLTKEFYIFPSVLSRYL